MFAEKHIDDDQLGSWLSSLIHKVSPAAKVVAKTGAEAYIATEQRKAAEAQARIPMVSEGFMDQIPWTIVALVGGVGIAAYMFLKRR